MKLTDDTRAGTNFIRAYAPDEIRVGERAMRTNCIVAADRLLEWTAHSPSTSLSRADIEPILALEPEIVILGTGASNSFPDPRFWRNSVARCWL